MKVLRMSVAILVWLIAVADFATAPIDLWFVAIVAAVGAAIWPWRSKRKEVER